MGTSNPATTPAEDAPDTFKPPSTRRKKKRKAHLPLLSRDSRDTIADDDVGKAEGGPEDHLDACHVTRQESTSDAQKPGANAGFAAVRNLYV